MLPITILNISLVLPQTHNIALIIMHMHEVRSGSIESFKLERAIEFKMLVRLPLICYKKIICQNYLFFITEIL